MSSPVRPDKRSSSDNQPRPAAERDARPASRAGQQAERAVQPAERAAPPAEPPVQIGVFDSGLGGLSVVRHLREQLPQADVVYFGDTARVPYGSKSRRTVAAFALDATRFLLTFEPRLIVAACHTVSALAVDDIRDQLPVPLFGVVEPGARAAAQVPGCGAIGVVGTEATISSNAYPAAIGRLAPGRDVACVACPLFVPMVEEGRAEDDPIVRLVAREYLAPLRERAVAAVVLGCTHYPLLRGAISAEVGDGVEIIDCGREAARAVAQALAAAGEPGHTCGLARLSPTGRTGSLTCYVSDNPQRFRRIGSRFLGEEIGPVELVDLDVISGRPIAPARG